MVTTLQLRYGPAPVRPAVAWYLPGSEAAAWLDELCATGLAGPETRLYVVPQSVTDLAPAGLLVIPAQDVRPLRSPAGFACGLVAGRLYVPCEARVSTAIQEADLASFGGAPVLFFHPVLGLTGFGEQTALRVWDLLAQPKASPVDWNQARPGPAQPAPLRSITLARAPTLAEAFGQAAQEIASEKGQPLPPAPGEPSQNPIAQAGRALRDLLAKQILRFSVNRQQSDRPAAKGGGLAAWARRQRAAIRDNLERLRDKELHRLLHLLDQDPEEGLRHAIRMSDLPHRGRSNPGASLVPHATDFDLGRLGGRAVDFWEVNPELQDQLRRRYHELATRELRLGQFRRAAYIFAELLGDLDSAARALRQGRHFREAALLYLERLQNPRQAAVCLAEGGLLREAIQIYEAHQQWLEAADLYDRLGETAAARAALRRVVEQRLAAQDRLGAATVLEQRLQDPDEALRVLEPGWPASSQAVACLRAQLDLLGRLGRHGAARERLRQLASRSVQPAQAQAVTTMLTDFATTYPDHRVRQACADLCLVQLSSVLSSDWLRPSEEAPFLALLPRLAPDDRLLSRDSYRYLAERRDARLQRRRLCFQPTPARRAAVELEATFHLPFAARWLSVCSRGRSFYVGGTANGELTLIRGLLEETTRGHGFQVLRWPMPAVGGPLTLQLTATASPEEWVALALAHAGPLAEQRFAGDDLHGPLSVRAGTPGWLPGNTVGLAFAEGDVWTLHHAVCRWIVSNCCLDGRVVWTGDVTEGLMPEVGDKLGSWPMLAAHPAGAMIVLNQRLVLARSHRLQLKWALPRRATGLVPTPAGQLGGALVLLESGAVMHWMSSDDVVRIDDELDGPRGAFLPRERLVLVAPGQGKCLTMDAPHATEARRFLVPKRPIIGVVPGPEEDQFAVFFEHGEVACFRICD
jgi:hypothetical protein